MSGSSLGKFSFYIRLAFLIFAQLLNQTPEGIYDVFRQFFNIPRPDICPPEILIDHASNQDIPN